MAAYLRALQEGRLAIYVFKCPNCGHIEEVPGVCGFGPDYDVLCGECESRPWRAYQMERYYGNININRGPSTSYDAITNFQMKNLK